MSARALDRSSATAALKAGLRQDIQGLRAVSVLAVVSNHLLGWPAGGFVGVDVFFVISGFLITGLLLREYESYGRISLAAFYRRRARRILPAAAVCLVLVIGVAALLYGTARFEAVVGDAFFSLLFVANWRSAVLGTDYLGSAGPASPLEHFWSLAVEEQFYLLWPLLLVVVLWAVLRWRPGRSVGATLGPVLVAVVAGSFAWAVAETASSPTWAYFSTLDRAWEIAAGALLAVAAGRLSSLSPSLRSSMTSAGLGSIAGAMFLIDPATPVPGPWSALPVAGAVLVLAAGTGGTARCSWLLTNAGSGYVGRISYSLYLWHLPVIVVSMALLPAAPLSVVATVVVMAAISVASFNLVEKPFRYGTRFRPITPRQPLRFAGQGAGVVAVIVSAVIVSAVIVSAVVVTSVAGNGAGPDTASPAGAEPAALDPRNPAAQLSAELEAAVRANDWPELKPAIDGISETGRPPKDKECAVGLAGPDDREVLASDPTTDHPGRTPVALGAAAECSFGDPTAPRLAVVAGDSIGITWIPLVRELLERQGFRIQGLTMSGCPFVGTRTRNVAADISAFCPQHKAAAVAAIRTLKPDIVFISNTYQPWLPGEPDVGTGANRYAQGQLSIIQEFAAATDAILVLAPPPPGKAPEECAIAFSTPSDCVSGIPDDWRRFNAAMAERLAGAPGTTYIDTALWFCTAAGQCPSFAGHTPLRRDAAGHVVPDYARRLAPQLERILEPRR